MKVLVISDFHGKVDVLEPLINTVKKHAPRLIVFCGDIVQGYSRGDEWLSARNENRLPRKDLPSIREEEPQDYGFYKVFFDTLESIGVKSFCVPGNMDAPISRYLRSIKGYKNVMNIHNKKVEYNGFIFVGFGGEVSKNLHEDFFVNIFKEDELEIFDNLKEELPLIFVMHTPPVCEAATEPTGYKGEFVVNELIAKHRPRYLFCGHAHKARGKSIVNSTIVVNPGPLKYRYFALVDTDSGEVQLLEL